MRRWPSLLLAVIAAATLSADASAQGPLGPLNDLLALGKAGGETPDRVPIMRRAEPPLVATPRAQCGDRSKVEPGIQGRVPAGTAANGLWCNVTLLSHQGNSGGFRVWRYVDTKGRECAFYDTALLFPLNAVRLDGTSAGVAVLDMSDPAHPVQTDTLTELPMLSPHESFNLNEKRGLLAAVLGNPATYPGLVSIYDASADCRHPQLQATRLVARIGHESGFSEDGKTFYAAGTAFEAITAVDLTHPKAPRPVWHGNVSSHGMSISADGNRAYIADATGNNMLILDTSEIQARKPNPQTRELSRLTWESVAIPQNAIPFTRDGKPYVLEIDEYTAGTLGGDNHAVGGARIIDVSDERQPRVIANLRLQINQRADHEAASGDPGMSNPTQGYASHYCNVPTRVDPKVVACSFIASGLRVFDISDITAPKEIAYFVAPTEGRVENGFQPSNFAMSQPAFAPERREVWYSDGITGFYAVRVDERVWPRDAAPAKVCKSRRRFTVRVRVPRGATVRATLAGKALRVRRRGQIATVDVRMNGLPRRAVQLVIRVKRRGGRTTTTRRTYHPCTPKTRG